MLPSQREIPDLLRNVTSSAEAVGRKEKITDTVAVDLTLEDLKSLGLALGEAKLLKKKLDALSSHTVSSPLAPAPTVSEGGGGGLAGGGGPPCTLDASILSPFISRVMSADDEDLDLRSPIEVRASRRSACRGIGACLTVHVSQGLEKQPLVTFAEACAIPTLVAAIPELPKYSRTHAPARLQHNCPMKNVTILRACTLSLRPRPASRSLQNWGLLSG